MTDFHIFFVVIIYVIDRYFLYDIIRNSLFPFDGCIWTGGLLQAYLFARTIIFDISRCTFDERKHCYIQNWKRTRCECPFSEDSKRKEEEWKREKGSRKKVGRLFFVSWKAANAREHVCNYNEVHRWNRFNGCNSLPVTSTATTFCRFAFSSYCISNGMLIVNSRIFRK